MRENCVIFVMTIDTEADNQWDFGAPLTTENVRYWPAFQDVCDAYGIKTTYLVTSEIAADPSARGLLRNWVNEGKAEVGAHVHPWTTPPFLDEPGLRSNDPAHSYLSELPADLVHAKLEHLTAAIEAAFDMRPTSFRAGRFGFDGRCAQALSELGYVVDTSVTPLVDWSAHTGLPGGDGGPDFTTHDAAPFVIAGTGQPGLLEIPLTIVVSYGLLRRHPSLLRLYRSSLIRPWRNRLAGRWLRAQPIQLRPVPQFTVRDLRAAWDESRRMNAGVAVMMVHSSELMPNGSPYRRTPESVQKLLRELAEFFGYIRATGAQPMTLSDAARALASSRALSVRALQTKRARAT